MPYDNNHGMRITVYPSVINIEIYNNEELYLPFMSLRNIGASLNEDNIYCAPKSRLSALIFIAQGITKIKFSEDDRIHVITIDELLIIAYTLPAFIVKENLDYIRMLRYKMINNGSNIFSCRCNSPTISAIAISKNQNIMAIGDSNGEIYAMNIII